MEVAQSHKLLGGSLHQTVPLDLAVERRAFDAENGGGLRLVPVRVAERVQDVLLLYFLQRFGLVDEHARAARRLRTEVDLREPNVGGVEQRTGAERDRPLDDVAQLA